MHATSLHCLTTAEVVSTHLHASKPERLAACGTAQKHSSAPRSHPELRLHPTYTLAVKQTALEQITLFKGTLATMRQRIALCETEPSRPKHNVRKPTCACGLKGHRDTHIYSSLLKTEGKHAQSK